MCGISGKLYFDPARSVEREILVRMNAVLAHRRLSIIDLSPAGHQPMANKDGTVWIVFNVEIHNTGATRRGVGLRHASMRPECNPGNPEGSGLPALGQG
jgi:asparagine synthetase B (glutamine-hydrolysing)